jgi:predicted membrane channel-forming protein YqfA (hemolysin III family)
MEAPTLPFSRRFKAVGYSLILILWWIGVWGIADTVIHLVFKGETMKELGVYIFLVTSVLLLVFLYPDLLERM